MKDIKSGNFGQCLADFFRRFGKTEKLWKFAKVSPGTEIRWRLGKYIPVGEIHLRVLFFLELIGYELDELKEMPTSIANVGRCVAFGVTTIESVAEKLSFDPQNFLRYVRGGARPLPERENVLMKIVTQHTPSLLEAIRVQRLELQSFAIDSVDQSALADISDNGDGIELIKEFSSACTRIRDIGDKLLKGPEERRKALRRYMNKPQSPELHLTWDVLHQLMKERKSDR